MIKTETKYAYYAETVSCYCTGNSPSASNSSAPAIFQKRGMPFFSGVITVSITIRRYYSSEWGRWLSRDPIEEKGGWNLYVMVGNDALGKWDHLGNWPIVNIDITIGGTTISIEGDLGILLDPIGDTLGEIWKTPTDIVGSSVAFVSSSTGAEKWEISYCCYGKYHTATVWVGGGITRENWGMSIGDHIFIGRGTLQGYSDFGEALKNDPDFRDSFIGHECGHCVEAKLLGIFYLPLVVPFTYWSYGIPPFDWAEEWADWLDISPSAIKKDSYR